MQVDLSATCDVFVKVDSRKQELRFEAKGARLLTGTGSDVEGGEVCTSTLSLSSALDAMYIHTFRHM